MTTVKATMEEFFRRQQDWMDKFSTNTGQMADLYSLDESMLEEGKKIMAAYLEAQKSLLEDAFKPENMGMGFPAFYFKMLDTQFSHFNKTTEYMQRYWKSTMENYRTSTLPKTTELVEENLKRFSEMAETNAQLVKDLAEN